MVSMSHDPAAGAIGLQLVDAATRGMSSGAAASMAVTALVPAGVDAVSAQAAAAFAAEGAATLALHTAAHEELARAGVALTDIARMYSQVDGEAAGTLTTAGGQLVSQPFVGTTGVGAGLLRAETLPGAGGSAARTPLLANLIEGAPAPISAAPSTPAAAVPTPAAVPGPATTVPTPAAVPGPATTMPGAVNAASTLLGAGAGPLSSLGSMAQGASAGGATGPGLASSLTEKRDKDKPDDSGQPGQHLV
jgi:hypothetical protein